MATQDGALRTLEQLERHGRFWHISVVMKRFHSNQLALLWTEVNAPRKLSISIPACFPADQRVSYQCRRPVWPRRLRIAAFASRSVAAERVYACVCVNARVCRRDRRARLGGAAALVLIRGAQRRARTLLGTLPRQARVRRRTQHAPASMPRRPRGRAPRCIGRVVVRTSVLLLEDALVHTSVHSREPAPSN
eukprot:6179280-Pleurochrysis_carterae.AAC.3